MMSSWLGGRRRQVKEQKIRKKLYTKLEPAFETVATKRSSTRSASRVNPRGLFNKFAAMYLNNAAEPSHQATSPQPSPPILKYPAAAADTDSLPRPTSLDILMLGGTGAQTTDTPYKPPQQAEDVTDDAMIEEDAVLKKTPGPGKGLEGAAGGCIIMAAGETPSGLISEL